MAVSSYIPQTLAEMKKVNQVTAERWIKDNASWVAAMVAKHDSWIKDNAVDLYQAAYDGELDEIEQRDKARDGGTENKLVSNYVQIIIDTLVDYMLGKSPIYTVEDPDQDDEEIEEREIITEYRKKVMKLLKDKAQGEFSDLLRDMCIGGFGSIIVWVDEKGNIDYSEYPIQEIIPIYDGRKRLRLLFRRYEVGVWENGSETTKTKVEVYDDRYVTYYTGDSMESLHLDEAEAKTGNPIEHKAGRIPVVVCQNQLPAKYSERVKGYGKSDLAYGVVPLAVAYCHGLSDKANLMEYLQDQYLCLTGVDVDENEVLKMRKARALALKDKDSKASFIAQSQDDNAVENGLTRTKNDMENADIVDGKYRDATFDSKTSAYCAADADYSKRNPYDLDYDTPMNPGLPGRRKKLLIENAVLKEAGKYNPVNPAQVVRAISADYLDSIEFDEENGTADAKSIARAIRKVHDAEPNLFKPAGDDGDDGNGAGGSGNGFRGKGPGGAGSTKNGELEAKKAEALEMLGIKKDDKK